MVVNGYSFLHNSIFIFLNLISKIINDDKSYSKIVRLGTNDIIKQLKGGLLGS